MCPLELRVGHRGWSLFPTTKKWHGGQGRGAVQKGLCAQDPYSILLSFIANLFLPPLFSRFFPYILYFLIQLHNQIYSQCSILSLSFPFQNLSLNSAQNKNFPQTPLLQNGVRNYKQQVIFSETLCFLLYICYNQRIIVIVLWTQHFIHRKDSVLVGY